jgi:hypothetical protein
VYVCESAWGGRKRGEDYFDRSDCRYGPTDNSTDLFMVVAWWTI